MFGGLLNYYSGTDKTNVTLIIIFQILVYEKTGNVSMNTFTNI